MTKAEKIEQRRLYNGECKKCYIEGQIIGRAFTFYICQSCKQEKSHSNTSTPKFCSDCRKKHNICCRCGKQMD